MDEEKRKKLEALRKELDPEVLSKMANYLGGDDAAAVAKIGVGQRSSSGGSTTSKSITNGSVAEKLKEKRALRFQERMAKKKREAGVFDEASKRNSDLINIKRPVLIFSSLDIWVKIIDSQFRLLGYRKSLVFSSFSSLMKEILNWHKENKESFFEVAVAFQDIKSFIKGWQELKSSNLSSDAVKFLDSIHVFFVIESMKQVGEKFVRVYGSNAVISITDEPNENRAKVLSAIGGDNTLEEDGESGREKDETDSNS